MHYSELPELRKILPGIRSRADRLDESGEWPAEDLKVLATLGAMRWAVPMEYGGEALSPIELHFRYEAIASASLTTSLILSQRDSAIALIAHATGSARWCGELLPRIARGELFMTVGIAQLTTSRQRGGPALTAARADGGYLLSGEIPWATGAAHCRFLVTGAVLDGSGEQILVLLPTEAPGVRVEPPLPLAALRGSHTSSVFCEGVRLEESHVLAGPTANVLANRKGALPIGQAFMSMGLCAGALDLIAQIDSGSARSIHGRLTAQLHELRGQVLDFCNPASAPEPARGPQLRGACLDITMRTVHAAISLHKGSGLMLGHPAQRYAREAMFLLVWSCPGAVVDCTLDLLADPRNPGERSGQADEG